MSSSPYGSLYVADLAKYCNENELAQLFLSFGPLIAVKIVQRTDFGSTGLVTLRNFEAADAAKQCLDGYLFMGKRIRVSWANGAAPVAAPPAANSAINSIYIRYSARKFDKLIRSDDLERIFSPYGAVTEVYIKDSHMDRRTLRQSGLAFVHFASSKEGMHSAFRAVSAVDGSVVQGITFRAELSRNLLRQFDQNEKSASKSEIPSFSMSSTSTGPMVGTPTSNMNAYPAYASHARVSPPLLHNGYSHLQTDHMSGDSIGDAHSFGSYPGPNRSMARPRAEFSAPMHPPQQNYCPPHLAPPSTGYSSNGSNLDYGGVYPPQPPQSQQPPQPPSQYHAPYSYHSQVQSRPQPAAFPGRGGQVAGNRVAPRQFFSHNEESMKALPVPVSGPGPIASYQATATAHDLSLPADRFASKASALGAFHSLRYGLGGEEPDLLLSALDNGGGAFGYSNGSVQREEGSPLLTASLNALSLLTTKSVSTEMALTASSDDTGTTREDSLGFGRPSHSTCSTVVEDVFDANPDGVSAWRTTR